MVSFHGHIENLMHLLYIIIFNEKIYGKITPLSNKASYLPHTSVYGDGVAFIIITDKLRIE